MKNKIKVLYIKPNCDPIVLEIEDKLSVLQDLVGGLIEIYSPFEDDEVSILCNEEGKLLGLAPNRMIMNKQGEIMDIIAGNFLIVGDEADEETFTSLSKEMIEKYTKLFSAKKFHRAQD